MQRIRALIAENPNAARKHLATMTCEALNWRGADGRLREMRCRVVMLRMHEQGLIEMRVCRQRLPAHPRTHPPR